LVTAGAVALAGDDADQRQLFAAALAVPGGIGWPFDYARIQLAYGERLRRDKETTHARVQLAAALNTFRRLGARPWAARASQELRATGVSVGASDGKGPVPLTPQQHEIATLAARGMTNREIGERLFLSPRTVGTHLYQVFPKLGITSRAALGDALRALPPDMPPKPAREAPMG
jgi:DNA-binding CsgD family transcriptional regulator